MKNTLSFKKYLKEMAVIDIRTEKHLIDAINNESDKYSENVFIFRATEGYQNKTNPVSNNVIEVTMPSNYQNGNEGKKAICDIVSVDEINVYFIGDREYDLSKSKMEFFEDVKVAATAIMDYLITK